MNVEGVEPTAGSDWSAKFDSKDIAVNGHNYTVYGDGTWVRHTGTEFGDVTFTPGGDGLYGVSLGTQVGGCSIAATATLDATNRTINYGRINSSFYNSFSEAPDSGLDKGTLAAALYGEPLLASNGALAGGGQTSVTQKMLVTAYADKGPGSDWAYYKGKGANGGPGSVGPGTIAVANAEPEEWLPTSPASPWYPYGSEVAVFDNNGRLVYSGTVHDTGSGWDSAPGHHNVDPATWIDIWLPTRAEAKKFGTPTLTVKIIYPSGKGPQ